MSVEALDFPKVNGYARLRRITEADLYGKASRAEAAFLREPENVVAWLRILRLIEREFDNATSRQKAAIEHLKPEPGRAAKGEYLAALKDLKAHQGKRLYFLRHVQVRIEEAVTLIGASTLSRETLGSIIDQLVRIEDLLDAGEIDDAGELLTYTIDRLEAQEN